MANNFVLERAKPFYSLISELEQFKFDASYQIYDGKICKKTAECEICKKQCGLIFMAYHNHLWEYFEFLCGKCYTKKQKTIPSVNFYATRVFVSEDRARTYMAKMCGCCNDRRGLKFKCVFCGIKKLCVRCLKHYEHCCDCETLCKRCQ
jgi:hypothetical protein